MRRLRPRAGARAAGPRGDRGDRARGAHRDAPARRTPAGAGGDAGVRATAVDAGGRRARRHGPRGRASPSSFESRAEPQELAPGVDLSAYRVIQEALTNALKYAGPAQAWVTVRWQADALELEIANDGRSEPGGDGGGHGLVGPPRAGLAGRRLDRLRPQGRRRVRRRCAPAARGARDDAGPDRRRPVARPRRVPDDPRGRAGDRGGRRGCGRARPRCSPRARPART